MPSTEITTLGFRKPPGTVLAKTGASDIAFNGQKAEDVLQGILGRLGQAEANIQAGGGPGPGLVEDPLNPGMFFMAESSPIDEDPENPGLYTF